MKRMMKIMLLLIGVCVLLLSAPTVSAVSLSVSPNLQQVFRGSSVSLSCVDDGQTADGWTVKRTRGGPTEDCGAAAASSFGQFNSSSCILSSLSQSDSAAYWCETSSGQSDQINITVTVKGVILLIPALPVWTGSDVTLQCSNGKTAAAYFFIKGSPLEHNPKPKHSLTKVQKSDEGFYSCSTNEDGRSPESSLRVRDPPPVSTPPQTPPSSSPPLTSTLSIHPPTFSHPHAPPPSSILVPVVAGLGSVVLLVLVLVGVLSFCRKPKEANDCSLPEDVTYADVRIRQMASTRDKYSADPHAVYSDVKTQTSGPNDVTYGQVVFKKQRKAGRNKEQPADPDVVYSSVRAGN
ncbi:uncharacterized protein LOC120715431 [Simochromis diagramma]|uniref:uncharacterized protein LOC120715431 n=1 Tax=Simochromis diagramma TaxID=43689 RepID=UPI001A7EEE5C|nr:uncharacterized protein LOC120715431 [Simochromis diagramma]